MDKALKGKPRIDRAVRKILNRIPEQPTSYIRINLASQMEALNPESVQPSNTSALRDKNNIIKYAEEYLFQVIYDVLDNVYPTEVSAQTSDTK